MPTKKIWLCLSAMATLVCQSSIAGIPNINATVDYHCNDIEVRFVEGYGRNGGSLANTEDSLAFEEQIERLMWNEETSSFKTSFEFRSKEAIVDFVKRPDWMTAAYIALNPVASSQLKQDIIDGGKAVANSVNYDENAGRCLDTKYIIAGFGAGAAKARQALQDINPDKVLYVALFSDPTLYLPEGKGLIPEACSGKNLSSYRMYVPNCRTHDGILGGANPYVPAGYEGKLGTWCNKNDMFCGSGISMSGHSRYSEDGIYEDAAKVIYDKIRQEYNLDHQYSPHDTAILIDSTGSMGSLISKYKTEALNLAKQTLGAGGRVALYDYRDYAESYHPVQHCNFETCTLQKFQEGLNNIEADGGGDTPESLLWSSKIVMNELKWRQGATKSLVVLTDAGYHNPDLDGTTLADIVKLSKEIDPVNMYVITPHDTVSQYFELTEKTDGLVVSSTSDLSLLTTKIMERYDSLPRVEETDANYEGDVSDTELIKTMYEARLATGEVAESLVSSSTGLAEADYDASASEDYITIPNAPNTGKQ